MSAREWSLPLAFTKPPLSLNDSDPMTRGARFAKAKLVKDVRNHAKQLAKAAGIPQLERFAAVLHYQPRDNRRRDSLNLMATVKPLIDGLVDAHVCSDDDRTRCSSPEPVIHDAKRGEPGRMWLVVVDLGHTPGTQTALEIPTTEGLS